MPVSRSLRFQILRRDNHTCRYCGASPPDAKLTVDHVIPEALGGKTSPDNLVTACDKCNGGKSATPPDAAHVAAVADDALRWSEAVRFAAASMLARRDERKADQDAFEDVWNGWGRGAGVDRITMPLPGEWRPTIDRFIAAGLPLSIICDAIPITMQRRNVLDENRFNYLCGILWNEVGELHDAAREQLNDPQGEDDEEVFDRWPWLVERLFSRLDPLLIDQCRKAAIEDHFEADEPATEDGVLFHTARHLFDRFAEGRA